MPGHAFAAPICRQGSEPEGFSLNFKGKGRDRRGHAWRGHCKRLWLRAGVRHVVFYPLLNGLLGSSLQGDDRIPGQVAGLGVGKMRGDCLPERLKCLVGEHGSDFLCKCHDKALSNTMHTSCRPGIKDDRYTLRLLDAPWLKRMMSVQHWRSPASKASRLVW